MARKLPWLSDSVKKPSSGPSNSAKPARLKRTRDQSDEDEESSVRDTFTDKGKAKERTARNPSSSPPPSPPIPEFMREGDDKWVQVEDEFLATAKLFTQHLHHAEYQKLKKQARSQHASAIQRISRPVDGTTKMSTESKMKIQGKLQRHDQKNAVKNIVGTANLGRRDEPESEDDDPWLNDPRLAGLMSHRDISTRLSTVAGVKSKTRASEGYSQIAQVPVRGTAQSGGYDGSFTAVQPKNHDPFGRAKAAESEDEFEHGSDGLDLPARHVINSRPSNLTSYQAGSRKRHLSIHSERLGLVGSGHEEPTSSSGKGSPKKKSSSALQSTIQGSSSGLSFDAFSAFPQRQASSYAERMAKRRAEAEKKEKQEARRKSEQFDEIPTFLI